MARGAEFLLYWRPDTVVDRCRQRLSLGYVGSAQLRRVHSGDTLWIITTEHGKLLLVGRLLVAEILAQPDLLPRLSAVDRANLWDAPYYALSSSESREFPRRVPITHIASSLRFVSASSPSLPVTNNCVDATHLQTIRRLTPASAALIAREWDRANP